MKEMYTVLWYQDNILIWAYREKQIQTLKELLQEMLWQENTLIQSFFAEDEERQREFLLHPDQSSILLCDSFIDNKHIFRKKIAQELEKFMSGREEEMIMNSGYVIEGTSIRLAVEDNNPLNSHDAHPDGWWGVGWGEKTPEEWKEVYDSTFALLKEADLGFFHELNLMIQKIVPFGTAKQIHYSASYKECVGTLYMWFTLDTDIAELHVLEWLVHESSHNKLNLIMQYEDITLNNFEEIYYSPYRPDARHIYGVFLGIHALIPTVYVLLHAIEKGLVTDTRWIEKTVMYHIKNKLGIATMKKFGILSPMWQQVFTDLIQVAEISDQMVKDCVKKFSLPVPAIQKRVKEHFMEVNKNYPYLQY